MKKLLILITAFLISYGNTFAASFTSNYWKLEGTFDHVEGDGSYVTDLPSIGDPFWVTLEIKGAGAFYRISYDSKAITGETTSISDLGLPIANVIFYFEGVFPPHCIQHLHNYADGRLVFSDAGFIPSVPNVINLREFDSIRLSIDGYCNRLNNTGAYFLGGTIHKIEPLSGPACALDPWFEQTTLTTGMKYYTDRDYKLTVVPSQYIGMNLIKSPNDALNLSTPDWGYLTFTMPHDGTVYVAYDSRVTSLPTWMNGFTYTGDNLETSLSTQPYLRIYSKEYFGGDCVDLGSNHATGSSFEYRSNYIVFYAASGATPACVLDPKFGGATLADGIKYYTDRNYIITDGIPDWMKGRTLIKTPNDDTKNNAASDYTTFKNPVDWWVYVLFDSRSSSVPTWLNGWDIRSDIKIKTSLGTQPYLKTYRKQFKAGQCVNLGGNYGPGSSGEYRSNYVVVYGK